MRYHLRIFQWRAINQRLHVPTSLVFNNIIRSSNQKRNGVRLDVAKSKVAASSLSEILSLPAASFLKSMAEALSIDGVVSIEFRGAIGNYGVAAGVTLSYK